MIVVAGSLYLGETMVCWARFVAVVGVVVVAALLSSCAASDVGLVPVGPAVGAGGDEPAGAESGGSSVPEGAGGQAGSVAPGEAVGAFHFDSGTLEIGPFDPLEVYPDVFDPCQEISAEEFAAAGFKTDGVTTPLANGSILSCVLLPADEGGEFDIILAGNLVDRQEISEKNGIYLDNVSKIVPGMFLYVESGVEEANCSAAVSTKRGHLIAFSLDVYTKKSQDDHCKNAIQTLENLARS
ncbi:DUF3558 family protein [Corynebacterium cystitidis]|uniref:DUF3558 domain-containing protein n=1 Tax=Corynebacterium cystitidis DSM 20524 TaxID=1121357 RepID=A0A1H9W893_9CORY|nr:DUF3558 family protein [Corynebacterium cystitidis]WJY83246.1 hypothetical protein CCYS_11780 [Corynebacterium cystitidis DSM 20524]SES29673.1 Protein of unknown function [Corynebacterium cystitidis DSM 20524]SNV67988.1 Uncharacterised protein [Corynebacterium cystitidis]